MSIPRTTRWLRRSAAVALFAALPAQCPVQTLGVAGYGQGCSPVFTTPGLTAQLDLARCSVDLSVQAQPGCCNTLLTGYLLSLGLAQASLPLPPPIPAGCRLLTSPDAVQLLPASAGATFRLSIPPALPLPLTVYAQGGAVYFTTIGLTTDLALTPGLQLALR